MPNESTLWLPKHLRPARRKIEVVFYRWPKMNYRITVGAPNNFPAPPGAEKIVCETAAEVELWSKRLREQERAEEEMTDLQREAIEGPIRDAVRKDLQHRMANSHNAINREFCRAALERIDEMEKRAKVVRESYMHSEGYEQGK